MLRKFVLFFAIALFAQAQLQGQTNASKHPYRKRFVGSSLFLLGNFAKVNQPDFAQLNFGYRLTPKDVVSVELITWKYAWPLGIPLGNSFYKPEEEYPGYIRSHGVALVYQRFLWKGLYAAVHARNGLQIYKVNDSREYKNGYQLFMSYRIGYHIPLFKNRMFIEPSVCMTHWPINTNVPEPFKALEDKWGNAFFPEPGLHFGVKF
jgi:hypothetical protein